MKEKSSALKRKLHLFIVVALTSSLLSFISTPVSAVPPLTCATGGICEVGDIGPGGGLVFYESSTAFACGPNHADDCTYLEVAPKSWSGSTPDAEYYWNLNAYEVNGISRDEYPNMGADQFGLGLKNSILMAAADTSTGNAGVAARGYLGQSKNDWYLPTIAELGILCQFAYGQTPVPGASCDYDLTLNTNVPSEYQFLARPYQSSSQSFNQGEASRGNAQWHQNFVLAADNNSAQQSTWENAATPFPTRPIRAFALAVTIEDQDVQCGSSNGTFAIVNKVVISSTSDCSGEITIPYGVTSIGYAAFWLRGITAVSMPNTVRTIADNAFRQTGLTSVTIPASVESIGYLAFGTTILTSLTFAASSNLTTIGEDAFQSSQFASVTIPTSVTSIASTAFLLNTNLAEINFGGIRSAQIPTGWPWSAPAQVNVFAKISCGTSGYFVIQYSQVIGRHDCTGSVNIPEGVTAIGGEAFDGGYGGLGRSDGPGNYDNNSVATNITSLTIPNTVTSIGQFAFRGVQVSSLTIPNSVTSIGIYTFQGAGNVETLTISSGLTTIPAASFAGLSNLKSLVIPEGVITIEGDGFSGTEDVVSLTLPNSLKSIGSGAFSNMPSLTSLTLGSGLLTLGSNSFASSGTLTYFRYCGYGALDLDSAGLGSQIAPSCIISNEVNGVSFEISTALPVDDNNVIHVRLSDINLIDSLTVTAMSGDNALTVTPEFLSCGTDIPTFKSCLNAVGAQYQITYRASDGNDPDLASITFTVQSVPDYAPEITYRQPIYKGRSEPEVQIDTLQLYTFLVIGGQDSVIPYSETETVNGLFENDRYRIDTGETGLKVKQIWTTADADTHINFYGTAPSSGIVEVTIKAGAFNAAYPAYETEILEIPINGCDGITAVCDIGDIGPGGGKIFYVESDPTGFASTAPECAPRCKYLEAAQSSGVDDWSDNDNQVEWSGNTGTLLDATSTAIGSGFQNTLAIRNQVDSNGAGAAFAASTSYSGGQKYDWFLPSKDELNALYINKVIVDAVSAGYWSSSEIDATQVWIQAFADGEQGPAEKSYLIAARPIRAFGYVTPAAILGVIAPVKDATPIETVEEGNGYTGTISWASDAGALAGNFQPGTIYTATITLTAKENYSFSGITENYFTVESATTTNPISSGVVTAVFASTGAGAPVQIEIWDGDYQNAIVGNIVADPLEVFVSDVNGNPVPDVSVSLIGDGTIFDDANQVITSVQTDASGYAFVPRWRLPQTRGEASLTATISTASGTVSVLFTATANRRPAAYDESNVSVSLNSIVANGVSTAVITVQARNGIGELITEGGDNITFAVPSSGSIGEVTDNGDGTYTATYTSGVSAGSVVITPQAYGEDFYETAIITLTSATNVPAMLEITRLAAGALDNRFFITQPQLIVRNFEGNTVEADGLINYEITLGDVLVEDGSIAFTDGFAEPFDLLFDGDPGMTYTLTFSSEGTNSPTQSLYLGKVCNGVDVACLVGDMGPGGGIVFYVESASEGFTSSAPECTSGCRYLEAAFAGAFAAWSDMGPGNGYVWSENPTQHFEVTQTSIGSGYANTAEIISDDDAGIPTASSVAGAYVGSGMSDWYLPSLDELDQLFTKMSIVGLSSSNAVYWSSSEPVVNSDNPNSALLAFASSGESGQNDKDLSYFVRPIRAFAGPPPACYTVINRIVTDSQSCSGIVEIPDDIIAIANDALSGSDSVSELVIGNGVLTIGANAFRELYDLTDLTLGNSIQTISAGAFRDATSLRALVIPDSVEVIGDSAFRDARRMLSLTLGNSIQTIEERAFFDARKIQSLMIPDSVEVIEFEAFAQTFDLRSLTLGNGLHTIQNSAFRYAARLTTINFGTGLRTIGANAFEGDEGSRIASLVIPDSVITIGNRAFGSASSLVSLTIGKNVETLGEDAFSYSDELLSYTYCGTLLTEEDLADAGLGGKERLACPQAPATNQVSSPTPNPRQLSKVFVINPTSAVSPSTIPVTISGEFVETVVNIAINGTSLPVGAWKQTRNEISFLMPSKKVGTYSIQLYNGSSPLLEPIAFIFTLTPEVKPESPAIDVSNTTDSEKSQESGVTTNLTGPESKKPLQDILITKIYFDMGSSAINLLNRKSLQNFAKRIAGLGTSISVSVKGFAQPTPGSQKTDQALSKKRASNVAQLLRNFGVNTRVTYAGAGRALLNVPKSRYVEIIAANK